MPPSKQDFSFLPCQGNSHFFPPEIKDHSARRRRADALQIEKGCTGLATSPSSNPQNLRHLLKLDRPAVQPKSSPEEKWPNFPECLFFGWWGGAALREKQALSFVTAPSLSVPVSFPLTRQWRHVARCRSVVCQGVGRCVQVRGAVEPSPGGDARFSGEC